MYVVGLTGGIASGKSTVSDLFAEYGIPVIDLDVIAHRLVEPGQPALDAIVAEFGPAILTPEGRLDRQAMRERIFSAPADKQQLEAILHPRIWQAAEQQMQAQQAPYCLLVIPLLNTREPPIPLDRILVVDVPESLQIERVMARDHITEKQARQIIASQLDRPARLALADDIIDNSGTNLPLAEQVRQLHERYLQLAGH